MSPALKSNLFCRGQALGKVRSFLEERGVLEVDTPILSRFAPVDTHIDIFEVILSEKERGFLHSSPEYGMKKLLAKGAGDIYQLGHVFRKEEQGPLHAAEFTMIEWYRVGTTQEAFLRENLDLIALFLGDISHEVLPYRKAFQRFVGMGYDAPPKELLARGKVLGFELHSEEDVVNLLWGCVVEPQLGIEKISIITDYPKEQAALAQVREGVAERFEFYFQGIELGNGYHELTDPQEQKLRLERSNEERAALGKEVLPIDPELIAALEEGLPDCFGIALGFDRLLMLQEEKKAIHSHF